MTDEQRIKKLEYDLDRTKNENRRLARAIAGSHHLTNIIDREYVTYLQRQILTLEGHLSDANDVIDQYKAHYARFGRIYAAHQNKRKRKSPQPFPLDRTT